MGLQNALQQSLWILEPLKIGPLRLACKAAWSFTYQRWKTQKIHWPPGVKYVVQVSDLAFENMDKIQHEAESNAYNNNRIS